MEVVNIDELYRKTSTFKEMNHYTSPEAFLSIISSERLRFTDCAFLNDIDEFNYIKIVLENCFKNDSDLRKTIDNLVLKELDENNTDYFLYNENKVLKLKQGKYYVLSGSIANDFLPTWSYYSKNEGYGGYCINIDVDRSATKFNNIDGTF